jgi:hypothetical protein
MDGHQGLIDTPLLLRVHPVHEFTEPPGPDGADLLNRARVVSPGRTTVQLQHSEHG